MGARLIYSEDTAFVNKKINEGSLFRRPSFFIKWLSYVKIEGINNRYHNPM